MMPLPRLRNLAIERKALLLMISAFGVLSVYRAYHYWTTGFFVSDEFGYYADAVHGVTYGSRWFFGALNILVFRLLGIDSVDKFGMFLPFYIFFWSVVTSFALYLILRKLELGGRTIALTLFSSFFLISFILLSLGFLTEPVGLALALLGVYFLIRYHKAEGASLGTMLTPAVAALFFSAATYTREPYAIFLIGGTIIVAVSSALKRKKTVSVARSRKTTVLVGAVLLFAVVGYTFLNYPVQFSLGGQVQSLAFSIGNTVNPYQPPSETQTTNVTITRVTSTKITETITTVISNTVMTSVTTTQTESIFTTLIRTTTQSPSSGSTILIYNTLTIFFGGIVLGWGPVLFVFAAMGLFILLYRVVLRRDYDKLVLLFTALFALGSYLVVSYIFAPDPHYFSFQNYSTIIRFSDTAIPAYFLTAPVFFSLMSKRKHVVSVVAVLLIFLVAAIPVYETYAASNINSGGNPFDLGFRSPSVAIRDYIVSNSVPANYSYNIVGVPYGWIFTPGITELKQVYLFTPGDIIPGTSFQSITYDGFIQDHWRVFYIYTSSNPYSIAQQPTYLRQLIEGNTSSSGPYSVVSDQKLLEGSGYYFIRVQLAW